MKCECPQGFPIERKFGSLDAGAMLVIMLVHTDGCSLHDTFLRYEHGANAFERKR